MNGWKIAGEVKCWSCFIWSSNNEIENADGLCPHCDAEIDLTEDPYLDDEPTTQEMK